MKIRISYNSDNELKEVIKLLHPIITSYKIAKGNTGQYKKAYIVAELGKTCTT